MIISRSIQGSLASRRQIRGNIQFNWLQSMWWLCMDAFTNSMGSYHKMDDRLATTVAKICVIENFGTQIYVPAVWCIKRQSCIQTCPKAGMLELQSQFQVKIKHELYQIGIPSQLVPLAMKSIYPSFAICTSLTVEIFSNPATYWATVDIHGPAFYRTAKTFYLVPT